MIETKVLGSSGLRVPSITLGTWKIRDSNTLEESMGIIEYAISQNITAIDTSPVYCEGRLDALIGSLKGRHPEILISTKIPGIKKPENQSPLNESYPREYLERKTEEILKSLNLDSVDMLQLHNWSTSWDDHHVFELLDNLRMLKDKGYSKTVGISLPNWMNSDDVRIRAPYVDFVQLPISLLQQWAIDVAQRLNTQNVGVLARAPLEHGALTQYGAKNQTEPAQIEDLCKQLGIQRVDLPFYALNFVTGIKPVTSVILGMNSRRTIDSTLAALEKKISFETYTRIRQVYYQ